MDLISLAFFLLIVFFANFFAASVGGGSILILPAMFLFWIPPALAVGTNRVHRVFATGSMVLKFMKEKQIDFSALKVFLVISIIGSIIGALVVVNLDEGLLKNLVLGILLFVVVFLLANRKFGLTRRKVKETKLRNFLSNFGIFLIAVYRAIIGSASGTFLRIYFVRAKGYDFLKAAAMSSPLGLVSSFAGAIIFIYFGLVDYVLAAEMAVVGMIGGYLGAKFAVEKGNKFIQALFYALAIVIILRVLLIG